MNWVPMAPRAERPILISAVHVRPGMSGSHEPFSRGLIPALVEVAPDSILVCTNKAFGSDLRALGVPEKCIMVSPGTGARFMRVLCEQLLMPVIRMIVRAPAVHFIGSSVSVFSDSRCIVTVHHDSVSQRGSMGTLRSVYFDMMRRLYGRVGMVLVPTDGYADYLQSRIPPPRIGIRAILHGTDAPFYSRGQVDYRTRILRPLVSVTNALPHKNLMGLLAGYFEARKLDPSLPSLRLVGRVKREDVSRFWRPEWSWESLILEGPVEHESMPLILRDSSVLVFVSHTETFGMPISEALATGLPVVASDLAVHREVAESAAEYVEPSSPEEIAEGILRARRPSRWCELSALGRSRSRQLTWRACAQNHWDAYRAVVDLERSRP